MVDAKTVVVSVVAVLSAFLQPGIRAQLTIDLSSEDDSCSQLEEEMEWVNENMRLRSLLESGQQKIKTLEKLSHAQLEENRQLKLENERSKMRTRESERESVKFIGSYGSPAQIPAGITQVEDSIYVLRQTGIDVFEDRLNFSFIRRIQLNEIINPQDIVYSKRSKCVYISGSYPQSCIWVVTTTGGHRVTKWLTNETWSNTPSVTNEGDLLVLKGRLFSLLEIYSLNATLIRRIQMPRDIKNPSYVVQTSAGNFIICHRLNDANDGQWVLSKIMNDGQLIHRFIPRIQSEKLNNPAYMSLDSDNNRLFVADSWNNRVILFDSNVLTWIQVLVPDGIRGVGSAKRMVYDASKKYLLIIAGGIEFSVYEIK